MRVVVDGKGYLQISVKPLHLRGLGIIGGGSNMFNPPRKTGVIKQARLKHSGIVRNDGLRKTKTGEIPLLQGLDHCFRTDPSDWVHGDKFGEAI